MSWLAPSAVEYESGVTSTPQGSPDRAAPMTAAPFVWREDGRPDWSSMWTSFCDLALHGGPPHRGIEQMLRGPRTAGPDAASDPAMVAEIRRGIWETTGLFAEPQSPGWIAVSCESRAMAEWLGAAIVLENVEVRVEDDRVLLPAGPRFRLENEVKSIVTVVAKTHHYGAMHAGIPGPDRPGDASDHHGFRCDSCGLESRVSRPGTAAELDATCPVDGTLMTRRDLATISRSPSLSGPRPLKVAVGGSGDGKTVLIDALRRRYGRRRAVAVSSVQAIEVTDHAVDLVLIEVGEDGGAPGFAPEMVDATIGVVVDTAGNAKVNLSHRRDQETVVFVDLATVEGIDVIASWLQRELLLAPWRERGRMRQSIVTD
jgi:hypothetical protein